MCNNKQVAEPRSRHGELWKSASNAHCLNPDCLIVMALAIDNATACSTKACSTKVLHCEDVAGGQQS